MMETRKYVTSIALIMPAVAYHERTYVQLILKVSEHQFVFMYSL